MSDFPSRCLRGLWPLVLCAVLPAAVSAQDKAPQPKPFMEPSEMHDKTKLRALVEAQF